MSFGAGRLEGLEEGLSNKCFLTWWSVERRYGSNIANTVHRAELAGIAAAVTHEYFLISANSGNSMRQIRKQIRYPELHTYHIHYNLLETIIKAIRNTATLSIRFLKVKAHTGHIIIGNELADQVAKHVAKHPEAADTGIDMAGHERNPFHNITWLCNLHRWSKHSVLMLATVINPSLTNSKCATFLTNVTRYKHTCIRSTNEATHKVIPAT